MWHARRKEMYAEFWWGNLKKGEWLLDAIMGRNLILEWILNK
jgi:hypothetical protein